MNTTTLSKEIMHRSMLKNRFNKNHTEENKILYKKQRNYCVHALKNRKKAIIIIWTYQYQLHPILKRKEKVTLKERFRFKDINSNEINRKILNPRRTVSKMIFQPKY